jgi:hypothetical protein
MAFIIFFAYFFVTASIVAFEDGFDETVKEKGYPSDFEKASAWKPEEYLIWALSWLPEDKLNLVKKKVNYLGVIKSSKKTEDGEDDDIGSKMHTEPN